MIEAKIIADSVNYSGNRITSWILTYPRFIHSEVMTHRIFSRNAASSRAIPVEKMIKATEENPAMPEYWGANQKGMQAAEELNESDKSAVKELWLEARDLAVKQVQDMISFGLHKQIANRLLEPFAHMTALVTATEFENFFSLRAHRDAQPEFQKLAFLMLELYNDNTPKQLKDGEWHLPFGDRYVDNLTVEQMVKICTARAARVSYMNFEGDFDFQKDYDLHDKLFASGHFSPFEHCAKALNAPTQSGNFRGWLQYRKTLQGENRTDNRIKLWKSL